MRGVKMTKKRHTGHFGETLYNLKQQEELLAVVGYWNGYLYVTLHAATAKKIEKMFPSIPKIYQPL
ncbi:hypothetical protein ACFYKX_11720 [Cytobacillus sp. FJAT-54145]|uniref:Uncharacterized protein n=1 Tax=Cytobacillus spartinae TaxID=3299023 RepID=A0ABW6KCF4_9BACI